MHDTPNFMPEYKALSAEDIRRLPKVLLHTTGNLEDVLAKVDGQMVVYIEHIVKPEDLPHAVEIAEKTPLTIAFVIDFGADDAPATLDQDLMRPFVVGAVTDSMVLARELWSRLVPVMLRGSIQEQVELQASMILKPALMFDDFILKEDVLPGPVSSWVRDRCFPIVCDPRADVENGAIESLADHPIELFDKLGFTTVVAGMDDELIEGLVEHLNVGLDEIFHWTLQTLRRCLLPVPMRQRLEYDVLRPLFDALEEDIDSRSEEPQTEEPQNEDLDFDPNSIDPALLAELGIDPKVLFDGLEKPSSPSARG